jgi:hypothetical protein
MAIVIPDWFTDEEAQEGLIALGIVGDLADEGSNDEEEADEGSSDEDEAK